MRNDRELRGGKNQLGQGGSVGEEKEVEASQADA